MENTVKFPCGCEFKVKEYKHGFPLLEYDAYNVNVECPTTWDMIGQGDTLGVFQLESGLGKRWSRDLKPENLEHLAALGSILRPGCLQSLDKDGVSTTEHYCRRKNGEEEPEPFHPAVADALKKTYGLLIFQEQALQIVKDIAKFSLSDADKLRRAIGKKKTDEMAKVEQEFIEKTIADGQWTEKDAIEIFQAIKASQRYSFNKAHAASYGERGFFTAYIKAHFPTAFYLSWLYYAKEKQDSFDRIDLLYLDAQKHGIKILNPYFPLLQPHFYIVGKKKIRFGLSNVRGVGEAVISKIVEHVRDAELKLEKQIKDFTYYETLTSVLINIQSSAVEALIYAGAFDYLEVPRGVILHEFNCVREMYQTPAASTWLENNVKKYDNLRDLFKASLVLKKDGGIATSEKTLQSKYVSVFRSWESPAYDLNDDPHILSAKEKYYVGVAIKYHAIDGCHKNAVNTTCSKINSYNEAANLICIGEITKCRVTTTKTGKNPGSKMGIFSLKDKTGVVETILLFPEQYKELGYLMTEGQLVVVSGYKKGDAFIVKTMSMAK